MVDEFYFWYTCDVSDLLVFCYICYVYDVKVNIIAKNFKMIGIWIWLVTTWIHA